MGKVKRFYAPGLDCMYRDNKDVPRDLIPMVLGSDYDALQSRLDAETRRADVAVQDANDAERKLRELQPRLDAAEAGCKTLRATLDEANKIIAWQREDKPGIEAMIQLRQQLAERDALLRELRCLPDCFNMLDRIDALLSSAEPVKPSIKDMLRSLDEPGGVFGEPANGGDGE
jgi:hypothetical protein